MFIDIINDIFNVIKVTSIKGLEKEVFDLASKEDLTIHDASYMYIAIRNKLILVTVDEKLRKKP